MSWRRPRAGATLARTRHPATERLNSGVRPARKLMCSHQKKLLLMAAVTLLFATSAAAQSPNIVASSSNQPSDGITKMEMDQGFLYRYQEYAKEIFLDKLGQRIEAMGKRLPANFELPAESFYITTDSQKLAATRFNVSGISNSIELLGIVGDKIYRVGCVHQSKEKVPLSYGPCADKIKEVFGVDLNSGFNVEHLHLTHDPSQP